ncbi:WD40 repeat domain-containing serine/threonine protein kinase [Peterkaempfera sp. SMS 1(5)a]|uniref:WD40 repeat domain-containing serine/threonine protein kinase n=1 Tax=Peterkaempfera podocarpi TaxID=3232308 RepID=UPI0036731DAE
MPHAARGEIGGGRYLLVERLASGGMGAVWEGRDARLNRTVAIKEVSLDLIPPIQREELVARAVHEGRNAAALADHPNIVTVYDVVIEHGVPWTVMQFVRGRSLAGLLQSGPMPLDAVAALAEQMLSALGFAHDAGIVHRDVKPLNIMINDGDGRALLTDFGIAKNSADGSLTQTGMIIGSTPYMAPERHEGESGAPPSDLFSLGVTLFEAVEGYSPFAKDTRTGTVTAILVKPLPAMVRAGRLAPLIQALTEKDPSRRPSVAQALTLMKIGAPTMHFGTTGTAPGTAATIPDTTMPPEFRHASGPITLTPPFSTTKRMRTVALSPDGRRLASADNNNLHLWDLATGQAAHLLGQVNPVDPLVFSADGRTLAGAGKAVWLWDLTTGDREAARRVKASHPSAIALSPDGRTLAVSTNSGVGLWDTGTGLRTATLKTSAMYAIRTLRFGPDGRMLAVGGIGGASSVWDVTTGTRVGTLTHPGGVISIAAFSPDGRMLAVAGGSEGGISLWDVASDHPVPVGLPDRPEVKVHWSAVFSPDGMTVAAGGSGEYYRYDLATGRVAVVRIGLHEVRSIAFGPDGRTIAASMEGRLIRLWHDAE